MKIILPFFTIVFVMLWSSSCRTAKIDPYFPGDHDSIIYQFKKDSAGVGLGYRDTLYLNIDLKRFYLEDGWNAHSIFYFEDQVNRGDTPFINDRSFLGYPRLVYKKHLYLSNMPERKNEQFPFHTDFVKVIPLKARFNTDYVIKAGDYWKIYRILRYANVNYDGKSRRALMLTITEKWFGLRTDTVWLVKGIGAVKWAKSNGYVGYLEKQTP